ncbi:hypothetical protein [Streptomyces sp. NPDC053079]
MARRPVRKRPVRRIGACPAALAGPATAAAQRVSGAEVVLKNADNS